MANSDKNIVITPNISSTTDNPKIVFSGADSTTTAQNLTIYAYPTDNGTLSFEGSAGQLFSITNNLTGTIFSVNDISGIPSIEVDDDGTIRLAEFGGNVLIGTATDDGTNLLQIDGSISATSGTLTGDLTANNLYVADNIYHSGDTDTYLAFGTDTITLATAGSSEITVNATGVRLGDTGNGYFQPVSGSYGSIQIDGGDHGGYEGYSIGGRAVFMHNNSTTMGLYDDVNNHWALRHVFNGATDLYYDGTAKLSTLSGGVDIHGSIYVDAYMYHSGDTNSYLGFSAADDFRIVVGGRQIIRCDEGTDPDKIQFYDANNFIDTNGNFEVVGTATIGGQLAVTGPQVVTTSTTAVSGDFLTVKTAGITITLPASPSVGDFVIVKDGTGAAASSSFTVARNGSNIAASATDLTFDKNFAEITMTYMDATIGWSV